MLNINKKTAYHLVRQRRIEQRKRGGYKKKALSDRQIDLLVSWFEQDCQMTLQKAVEKVMTVFGTSVSTTTVGNYLDGRIISFKKIHREPEGMNNAINKEKRRQYVLRLCDYLREGKEVIFIDETNFNLFCKRTKGWARVGDRASVVLPNSREPNLHLIAGITNTGLINAKTKRGSFKWTDANNWLREILEHYRNQGHDMQNVVVVCDNAPCHSKLEDVMQEEPFVGVNLLRLAPYSCMLNPIEGIWSKIKSKVKSDLGIPATTISNIPLGEQRLRRLEEAVGSSFRDVRTQDCIRCITHSTSFHPLALDLQDMLVGN